jgi:NitT/TauT family transport system ATP-binding protein
MTAAAVECRNLGKTFSTADGPVVAIENLSFSVRESEFVCLIGPTGCGKTTVLKMVDGLIEPDSGEVMMADSARGARLRTCMVFQEHGLFPWMNVLENVAFGLEARGVGRQERLERAATLVEAMGLGSFAARFPRQLSVGMRQRVGIGRALLAEPDVLLMDEPFGALDAQTRRVLQGELLEIWERARPTVIFVTHDIGEAVRLADRVMVMSSRPGRIIEDVEVSIERPRDGAGRSRAGSAELEEHLWHLLEGQALRSLGLSPEGSK